METRPPLRHWLAKQCPPPWDDFSPLAGDASFRCYHRLTYNGTPYVVMDAPPPQEDCRPFVAIAHALKQLGIHVPTIHAADLEQGFLLLSDLGDDLYLKILNPNNAEQLYGDAIHALLRIQSCNFVPHWPLPAFDHQFMQNELNQFRSWCLTEFLGLELDDTQQTLLEGTFKQLILSATAQPQVLVHRDYHSRNLLRCTENTPGVLDFQDAVWGPVTYDLVSLLRDCYINWPHPQVQQWALNFYSDCPVLQSHDEEQFMRWFDWMGIQRHLKALYIFARKYCRDNDANYLGDMPRTLNYAIEICRGYPELNTFGQWLDAHVSPALNERLP